jgi:hypothetical protein
MIGRKSNFLPSPCMNLSFWRRGQVILLEMILNVLGHEMEFKYIDKEEKFPVQYETLWLFPIFKMFL